MTIRKLIFVSIQLLSRIQKSIRFLNSPSFRIEEIDINAKTVIIQGHGVRPISLKLNISKAIADPLILSNLSPIDACWLGYCSGTGYTDFFSETENSSGFKLAFKNNRFKILSQNRKGEIIYIDTKSNKSFTEHPLNIAQNEYLIMHFDPSQACFIGILAGICAIKPTPIKDTSKPKPLLKVVS